MSRTLAPTAAMSPALAPGTASKHKSLCTVRTRDVFLDFCMFVWPERSSDGLHWARHRPSALCGSPSGICEGICKAKRTFIHGQGSLTQGWGHLQAVLLDEFNLGPKPSTMNDEPWPKSRRTSRIYSRKMWCKQNIAAWQSHKKKKV